VYDAIGWPGVVLLMALEGIFFFIPSEAIMPLAGWLLVEQKGHGWEYLLLAAFYGSLGSLLGALFFYYLGMWGGRPFLLKYGRLVLITPKEIEQADRWFARYGEITVFASRMVPLLRSIVSLPAGIARMNIWRFSILTFLGSYPWSLGLAASGYLLGENWEDISSYMRPVSIPIAVAVLAVGVFYVYRRIREIRAGEATGHGPKEMEAGPP
jgi:membrane protein DedA with SNARE-associated domain